ncbi:MAG: Na+/H+ antiporter NhaA [Dehalococcoidia bacterium]
MSSGHEGENNSEPWWLPPRGRQIQGMIQEFMRIEASGGIVLLAGAIIALIWVNTATHSYHQFWEHELTIGFNGFEIREHLSGWVNDALMTIFFFVVGLEIKRELVVGELRDPRAAAMPILAAAGGMIAPAIIYARLNQGGDGLDGWGIPVATDIAFVVGVLALFGRRLPAGLRVFLLTLAIADDIGGIVIIAVFYTSDLSLVWLGGAAAGVGVAYAMQYFGVWRIFPYAIVGVAVWYMTFESGVHATIAGVVLGLLTPARPYRRRHIMETLEHRLLPWSSFVIVPIFALANAGVEITGATLQDAFSERITWGIVLGLVVGKTVGIFTATYAGLRLGAGRLPEGVHMAHAFGGAMLGGIGFTVALFIAELSFSDRPALLEDAKLGVFAGSLLAGILGSTFLLVVSRLSQPHPAPAQLARVRAHRDDLT